MRVTTSNNADSDGNLFPRYHSSVIFKLYCYTRGKELEITTTNKIKIVVSTCFDKEYIHPELKMVYPSNF